MTSRPAVLATAAAIAVLAVAAAASSAVWRAWLVPPGAICRIGPSDLDTMLAQQQEENRGHSLSIQLAALQEELGRARLQCPLPDPPPRAEPPQAALPPDRWANRELAMMEGCWRRETAMTVTNTQTGRSIGVRSWVTCFNPQGTGTQRVVFEDGTECEGPVRAEFRPDGRLGITDTSDCVGSNRTVFQLEYSCQRISGELAVCDWVQPGQNRRGGDVRLRR
jgi:hypothetical protein